MSGWVSPDPPDTPDEAWRRLMRTFAVAIAPVRGLVRWSARAIAASVLFNRMAPPIAGPSGLAESVAADLQQAAICAATVPPWLPVAGLVLAVLLVRGAVWSAIAASFLGAYLPDDPRALRAALVRLRPVIRPLWRTPGVTVLRWRLVARCVLVGLVAGTSGVLSIVLAGWVLNLGWRPASAWALVLGLVVIIDQVEDRLTPDADRWRTPARPPSADEAVRRRDEYLTMFPDLPDGPDVMLYSYTSLELWELRREVLRPGATGWAGRADRLTGLVMLVLFLGLVDLPSLDRLGDDGFLGCLFVTSYQFFSVAQQNLLLFAVTAVCLTVVKPVFVRQAWRTLMVDWRFPAFVRGEVLHALRRTILLSSLNGSLGTAVYALLRAGGLAMTAAAANRFQSPILGLLLMVLSWGLLGSMAQVYLRRRFPSPGSLVTAATVDQVVHSRGGDRPPNGGP